MSFTVVLRRPAKLPGMKKIMAVAGVGLALAGALALAGCAPRANAAHGSTQPGPAAPVQNQPAAPAQPGTKAGPDSSSVDSDLNGVDTQLGGIDSDLSAAAQAPGDAD
jgi:hypothetical protein